MAQQEDTDVSPFNEDSIQYNLSRTITVFEQSDWYIIGHYSSVQLPDISTHCRFAEKFTHIVA